MLRLWLAMGVGVATLIVSGLVASMARAQGGVDPVAIVAAYEMARNGRDVDTALSYFADDATVNQRSTTFTGKDEIRRFLDGISARSRFVVVSDRHVNGNRVTWTERPGAQGPSPSGGIGLPNANNASSVTVNVEAVVQDGKLRSLAYMSAGQPLRTDTAVDGRAQLPAGVGLGAVATVLAGVLMVASAGLSRRRVHASSLQGRLMHDLQGWRAARQ